MVNVALFRMRLLCVCTMSFFRFCFLFLLHISVCLCGPFLYLDLCPLQQYTMDVIANLVQKKNRSNEKGCSPFIFISFLLLIFSGCSRHTHTRPRTFYEHCMYICPCINGKKCATQKLKSLISYLNLTRQQQKQRMKLFYQLVSGTFYITSFLISVVFASFQFFPSLFSFFISFSILFFSSETTKKR